MSIKTKIRSLIDAANAKTGKGDTDLTTAVQSLSCESGGITPSGNKAITATTSTLTDIDVTNYATVSVAPTPSEAIVVTTNGDATPSSGKLLSMVTVDVPTGEARDSSDLTVSGATVNVPAGLYSSAASKSVTSGTAGTPTASKGAVSNHSVTVTPSVANTTGYITGGTKTGAGVTVSASELVSGNKAITPSETAQSGIDVTNFKTVSVDAISSTYVGSGITKKAAAAVAPSTSEQTVCASGVYTTGEQKVSAITPSIVGNLDADSFASSIVAAIEGKSVDVPDGAKLSDLAALINSIKAYVPPVTLYISWSSVVGTGLVSLTQNGAAMSVTDFISKMQSGAKIIIGENNDGDSESSGFSNYRYKITDSTTASLAFDVANSFNGSNRTIIISGSSSTDGLMTGYQDIAHDDLSDYSPLPEGIEAGGGAKIATGSFTPAENCNHYVITHNLGEKPNLAICICKNIVRQSFSLLYDDSTQRIVWYNGNGYLSGLADPGSSIINQTSPSGSKVGNSGMYNATENTIKAGNELLSINYFVTGAQYIWIVAVI